MSERNQELWAKAKRLSKRHYTTQIFCETWGDGSVTYAVEHPDLNRCMGRGETQLAAYKDLDRARLDYIYSLLEGGLDVPLPFPMRVQTMGASYSMVMRYNGTTNAVSWDNDIHHAPARHDAKDEA
jgi:hypothetical protein